MADDNSVNIKKSYHHGDLRAALVAAGLKLLESRAADDLGLREVARAVGVSPTAVYRHFPDKAALLKALAREGLAMLAAAQHAAAEQVGGGAPGFSATGRAYVRFALANPALFRLIFASGISHGEEDEAMAFLKENAAAFAGGDSARARLFALQAWSLAHGLAMLMLDGEVSPNDALIDAVVDAGMLRGQA